VGDDIWISGTLGDARLALACYWNDYALDPGPMEIAARRMHMPTPRVALGLALATGQLAHAAIDISDGLVGDIGHILSSSNVGATLALDALPAGPVLAAQDLNLRRRFCAAGGDDYELCFTAPSANRAAIFAAALESGTAVTRVGTIDAEPGLRLVDGGGAAVSMGLAGFDHFKS
jgi:thiamine-monophosphate kinase